MKQAAKLYLAESLIYLMNTKDLDDISIKEIVQKAGVSRMTYYRYFSEKTDILIFYMDYLFDKFIETEKNNDNSSLGSVDHIKACLEYFRNYSDFALCIYKTSMEGIMLKAINRYMERHFVDDNDSEKNRKKAFSLYAYSGAIYNCYMQWILSDFKLSSNEIANILKTSFKFD